MQYVLRNAYCASREMPDLLHSLLGRDLGHLRIVAGMWGIELTSATAQTAVGELCTSLLDPLLLTEILEALPAEARVALATLAVEKGRIPWAAFTRRFGEIREMGPGRRDREQPHLRPVSPAEMLFYRGLLARAFFDTSSGLQEFAYIPEDLLKLIQEHGANLAATVRPEPLGHPAAAAERAHVIPADDHILDDATTLLASLRMGWDAPPHPLRVPQRVLLDLLSAARLIRDSTPQSDPVKAFLEAPRPEALGMLVNAWQASEAFDELRQLPTLLFEGEWNNLVLQTRNALLGFLETVPKEKWWSLSAFVSAIKEKHPDFQRSAGDYDAWFIRRQSDGEYLRSFDYWDEVEGALIRYFVTGILHWLGRVDLAAPEQGKEPGAFRMRSEGLQAESANVEQSRLFVSSPGRITAPRSLPRAARYQIARFCDWEDSRAEEYRYRVTASSLEKARAQKLKVAHLLALLQKHAAAPLPPAFVKALKRWEVNGAEARVENQVVLRVSRPEVLEMLRKSRAARFLGEPLGPTAAIVKPGAGSKIVAALAEIGLLAEDKSGKPPAVLGKKRATR